MMWSRALSFAVAVIGEAMIATSKPSPASGVLRDMATPLCFQIRAGCGIIQQSTVFNPAAPTGPISYQKARVQCSGARQTRSGEPVPASLGVSRQFAFGDALARGPLKAVDHRDVARVLVGRYPLAEPS
jgi:hypothetical protein